MTDEDIPLCVDRALCMAAWEGHTETVRALLDAGADVHARTDAPLWVAAMRGHADTMRVARRRGRSGYRAAGSRGERPCRAGQGTACQGCECAHMQGPAPDDGGTQRPYGNGQGSEELETAREEKACFRLTDGIGVVGVLCPSPENRHFVVIESRGIAPTTAGRWES